MHPDKSKVLILNKDIQFLGFRVFYFYKLLKKNNIGKMKRKILIFEKQLKQSLINYDKIYASFEGWLSYTIKANTFNLRKNFIEDFEIKFKKEVSSIEVNRLIKSTKNKIYQGQKYPSSPQV